MIIIFFLAELCSLQDLSSPTRDPTGAWQGKDQVLTTGQPGDSHNSVFLQIIFHRL